jgi:hypothetical protein
VWFFKKGEIQNSTIFKSKFVPTKSEKKEVRGGIELIPIAIYGSEHINICHRKVLKDCT